MRSEKTIGLPDIKEAIGRLTPAERRNLIAHLLWRRREASEEGTSLRLAVFATLLGLAAFLLLHAFFFQSGWYNKYLEPDSTTGQVEYNLFWLRRTPAPKVPDVLVVGDSRVAEGFSARIANGIAPARIHFVNFGMPGSSPRVWYYALRDADPGRNRFAFIVIAFDQYSDIDGIEAPEDRPTDLNYLAGRLKLSDCWSFARSYAKRDARRDALGGCLVRGIPLRSDILRFLSDMPGRLKRTRDWRDHGAGYIDGYGGKPEQLTGLTFDPAKREIHFPAGLKDWQTASIKATLTPEPAAQTGSRTAYRRKWIGGILNLYKDSSTRIVFTQLPNAPVPVPDSSVPARFIQSVASRPRLTVLPAGVFGDLRNPDLFADGLHLNTSGRRLFSERLARAMDGLLH